MKIIHLITRLEPGGSSKNTLDSASWQAGKNDVIVARGPCEREYGNIPVRTFLLPNLVREISPLRDIAAFFETYRLLRAEEPDILHTHTSKAGLVGRMAGAFYRARWKKNLKIVHTPHGHVFYGYFGKAKSLLVIFAERLLAGFCDVLIALTRGEKEESESFGVKGNWRVIHSGVDLPEKSQISDRSEFGFGKDDIVVGTVARFERVKGVEYLLDAAAGLTKGNIRFLLVGDGSLHKKLRKTAERSGLAGRVVFTGFRNDPLRCIAAMDVYVQPSLNEGMGRSILEAMSLGKPVVAFGVCGIRDLVVHGINGFLARSGDREDLSRLIGILAENGDLRKRFGENGRRKAFAKDENGLLKWGVEAMNTKLEKLYNELIAGRKNA